MINVLYIKEKSFERREMKRRIVAILMLCAVLTGCQAIPGAVDDTNDSQVTVDDSEESGDAGVDDSAAEDSVATGESADAEGQEGAYDDLISEIKAAVEKGDVSSVDVAENTRIKAGKIEEDTDIRYGYLIKDLDGDGVDELILGSTSYIVDTDLEARGRYNSIIYDIFTLSEGKPKHVVKSEGYDKYYFGTDGTIVKEVGETNSDTIMSIATFNKFNKDKLDVAEGIRYDMAGDDIVYYRSDSDPLGDGAEKIAYEDWKAIIDKHGYDFVKFTPFVEPAAPTKKATVYVRNFEEEYLDGALQYKWREYVKYYDDHTGYNNVGDDPSGKFSSYDEEAIDDLVRNGFVEEK